MTLQQVIKSRWLSTAAVLFILSGCASVGPDYVPPVTSVAPVWNTTLKGGLTASDPASATLTAWWTTFDDPALNAVVNRAIAGNLDLKTAAARIREARARRAVAKAGFFPTLDAMASATRARTSGHSGPGTTTNLYSVGFDANWEVDVFGGVRRSVEAATADLDASREDLNNTLVSLLSEAALNYIEVRTFQSRLAVANANLGSQTESCQLALWRNEAGLSDRLAVEQARYNLESTRAQIPNLTTGREDALNRLAVITGEQPGALHRELERSQPIPMAPAQVVVGIPADLLRRRPDIRRAERELAAQTARVGLATADLYPKLTLSGFLGLESLSTGNLFSAPSKVFSIGSGMVAPIFRAGALRQKVEIQSALQEQALLQYEAAVLTALKEAENALVAYGQELTRREALLQSVQAAKAAADLAQSKFQAGLTDFTAVLEAQRSLFSFQDQLVQSEGSVTSNLVRLYKALGGGWEPSTNDAKRTE